MNGALVLWWTVQAFAGAAPASPEPAPTEAAAQATDLADTQGRVVRDGPVAVTVRVSPDPSYIGDLVQLTVVAAYPKTVSVNLPIGLVFDPLHLVGIEEAPPEATGQGLRKTFTITLQYFDVGAGTIPAFPLTWVGESDEVHTLEIPRRTFQVDALLANEADPVRRDEDPPVNPVYPNATAEMIIYAVFATLLAGLLGWVFGRRYFGRPKPVYVPPPDPAHTVALSALQELEGGDLIEGERFTDYYVQLTEIAKGYLQGRFGIDALDRTTEELHRYLTNDPGSIEPLSADEVIRFLQECDLVKFARFNPPAQQAHDALGEVRTLVESSSPKDGVASDASPAEDDASLAEDDASLAEDDAPGVVTSTDKDVPS